MDEIFSLKKICDRSRQKSVSRISDRGDKFFYRSQRSSDTQVDLPKIDLDTVDLDTVDLDT